MAAKTFSWIGTGTGAWSNPANWADATDGMTPSTLAPGTLDVALFTNTGTAVSISGSVVAGSLDIAGTDVFSGNLNVGTLTIETSGTLESPNNLTITADTLTALGSIVVPGALTLIVGGVTIGPTTAPVACFAQGTRIATPHGSVAVENLRQGDRVTTFSGIAHPIQWIGRRCLDCRRHTDPERVRPVRIARHAFGLNRPERVLMLSPDHSIFVEGVLIPIKYLINDATVAQISVGEITYYHLELANHDVVLAEGLPAETYLETGTRSAFENGGSVAQLQPDFAPDQAAVAGVWLERGYAPLLGTDGQVDRVAKQLAWQAIMLGYGADASAPTNRTTRRRA